MAASAVDQDREHPDGGRGIDVEVGHVTNVDDVARRKPDPLEREMEDRGVRLLDPLDPRDDADGEQRGELQVEEEILQPRLVVRDHPEFEARVAQRFERRPDIIERCVVRSIGERPVQRVGQAVVAWEVEHVEEAVVDTEPEPAGPLRRRRPEGMFIRRPPELVRDHRQALADRDRVPGVALARHDPREELGERGRRMHERLARVEEHRTEPHAGRIPTLQTGADARSCSWCQSTSTSRSSSSSVPSLSINTSAACARSAKGSCAAIRARTSLSSMPRATDLAIWVSIEAETTTTMSQSRWVPISISNGLTRTTTRSPSRFSWMPSANILRTSGCTIASRSKSAAGSAKTIDASFRRSSSPSGPRTSAPKRCVTFRSPSDPATTAARAKSSASKTTAPRSRSMPATVDFPDPIPPVNPTRSMRPATRF